jgi:tetratricopeptide (TPR) repeat protein
VIGTAIALPAAAVVASGNVAGHEWGDLFLFGVLFGIGAVLTVPDLRSLARLDLLLFLGGMALLVVGPASADAGRPLGADAPLAAVGAALLALVVWRTRAGAGPFLLWLAGLLLLTALAYKPLAGVPAGSADAALWTIGGAMSLGTAALVAIRRWFRTAADGRVARADSEYARREFEKAIASYDAGIALARRTGRESAAGWYGKGAALVAVGRLADAVEALDRALAVNPENEIAWINKGTALSRMGRMNEALRCYNSAIKVNPSYEVAWNNKGNALARLGRHELALECYDRALVIDGAYRTAWVNKGFVLTKLGRFEEAATCADTAVRLTDGIPAVA